MPSEGLTLDMDHEKTFVMSYRTLFEGYAIHNSNRGLQITHDMYSNGYFMVLFYLAPERGTSESHTSLHENSNIRIEMQFSKPLPESITCLLYLNMTVQSQLISRAKSRPIFNTQNGHLADSVYAA